MLERLGVHNGYMGLFIFKCTLSTFDVHLQSNKVMNQDSIKSCYNHKELCEQAIRPQFPSCVMSMRVLAPVRIPSAKFFFHHHSVIKITVVMPVILFFLGIFLASF